MSDVTEPANRSCAPGRRSLEGINSRSWLVDFPTYSEAENKKKGDVSR
jgi:hypothetical protein